MATGPLRHLWDAFLDHVWQEGRVIYGAPVAFVLGVVITTIPVGLSIWKTLDWWYSERISILETTIQSKDERILQLLSPKQLLQAPKDPESIIQFGETVGRAVGARRSPTNAGIFIFAEITHGAKFNINAEFEYQQYILRVQKYDGMTGLNAARPQDGTVWTDIVAAIVREKGSK